jgi:hypothetical protein
LSREDEKYGRDEHREMSPGVCGHEQSCSRIESKASADAVEDDATDQADDDQDQQPCERAFQQRQREHVEPGVVPEHRIRVAESRLVDPELDSPPLGRGLKREGQGDDGRQDAGEPPQSRAAWQRDGDARLTDPDDRRGRQRTQGNPEVHGEHRKSGCHSQREQPSTCRDLCHEHLEVSDFAKPQPVRVDVCDPRESDDERQD